MDRRAFAYGVLGWAIPGIATAIPFVGMREAVGGQALFGAGALWLLGLESYRWSQNQLLTGSTLPAAGDCQSTAGWRARLLD